MSTEWRKILISGSNAHVAAITSSVMGSPLADRAEVLFRQNSSGRFFSTASIYYTSSNQLILDGIGLEVFQLSASGVPDLVSNNSTLLFYNNNSNGLEQTSSLYFNTTNNQLEFVGGTFSGSFTGDGSGLTGVIGTLPNPLTNANGIISSSGANFSYDGTTAVAITVFTASNSGLDFTGGGLHLVSTLTGEGLRFPEAASSNYSTMSIDLAPNSGLDTGSGLSINSGIGGNGLSFAAGVLDVDLATNSGLALVSGELRLASSLAGTGLSWANNYDELEVDPTHVVTSSATVTFKTGSDNLTLTGDGTAVVGGYQANLIDEPTFTYDLSSTLSGSFNFAGNVYVNGNFTVSGTFATASFETENLNVTDQFILVNSGSDTGDGGFVVQTTTLGQGAFLFYDSESARWGVSDSGESVNTTSHLVSSSNHAALVTTTIVNDNEATLFASTPLFGVSDSTRAGQLIVTTAPLENESSVYIYA